MDIVSEILKKFSVSKPTVKKWLEGIKRPTYSMMPAIIRGFVEMIEELEDERDKYHRKAIEDCDRADRLVDELDNLQKKWTDVPDEYSDMGEFLTALKDMMFESEKDFEKMMDERDEARAELAVQIKMNKDQLSDEAHMVRHGALINRIEQLESEVERLKKWQNPTITLLTPAYNDPFKRAECEIVDIGVSDRIFVIECPEIVDERDELLHKLDFEMEEHTKTARKRAELNREVEHLSQENSILNSEVDEADPRIRAWEKFGEVIKWLYFCDKCLERNSERIENAFKLAKEALGKDDENE
jgi:transcriptional regulator with XRE-family HTH domain